MIIDMKYFDRFFLLVIYTVLTPLIYDELNAQT